MPGPKKSNDKKPASKYDKAAEKKNKVADLKTVVGARDPKAFEGLMNTVNEEGGIAHIQRLQDAAELTVMRYPTWFLELDVALRGGAVIGKLMEAWGEEGSGKTTLMFNVIESCQNFCHVCYTPIIDFVDFDTGETERTCACGACAGGQVLVIFSEDRFDEYWAKCQGVDTKNNFFLMFPSTLEQGAGIMEKATRKRAIDLLCIDSYAAFTAEEKIGRDVGDARPGTDARGLTNFMSRFFSANMSSGVEISEPVRKAFKKYRPRETPPLLRSTIFGTNQVRANISTTSKYKPYIVPGGHMLRHLTSQRIQINAPTITVKDGVATNAKFNFDIRKNFAAAIRGKGSYQINTVDHGDDLAGADNEATRIVTYLKDIAKLLVEEKKGKTTIAYHFAGMTLKTLKEWKLRFRNRGMQWFARWVIMTRYFLRHDEALEIEGFDYNPFYKIVHDGDDHVKGEKTIPRWKLVRRNECTGRNNDPAVSGGDGAPAPKRPVGRPKGSTKKKTGGRQKPA